VVEGSPFFISQISLLPSALVFVAHLYQQSRSPFIDANVKIGQSLTLNNPFILSYYFPSFNATK
jgi:hypothetical protein